MAISLSSASSIRIAVRGTAYLPSPLLTLEAEARASASADEAAASATASAGSATAADASADEAAATAATLSAALGSQFIVSSASAGLTAERVLTDTATVTWDFGTAGQAKASATAPLADGAVTAAKLATSALGPRSGMVNGTLVQSRTGNAETFAIKTLAGTDPTASDPVYFVFRTAAGAFVVRTVTAALSVTVSSGSTLGATNSVAFRVWCVAADDGGTVRLGVVNTRSSNNIMALNEWATYSSTAEGGAGAADSAQVIYSGTAFSAKYIALVGFGDWDSGLATVGTWGTAPTRTILFGPGIQRPGEVVQMRYVESVAYDSTTTVMPSDDTLPQNTEGKEAVSVSVTFTSAANVYEARAGAQLAIGAVGTFAFAVFTSASASAIAAKTAVSAGTNYTLDLALDKKNLCASTSALTFSTRFGPNGAYTAHINGSSAGRLLGGATATTLTVTEIMA